MKKKLLFMLTLLCTVVQGAKAGTPAVEETYRYMVMLNGVDALKLDMPVYDEDNYDAWIDKGYVYIMPEGGPKETLFYFSTGDKGSSGSDAKVKCYKGVDGVMQLLRDRSYTTVNVTGNENTFNIPLVSGTEYHMIHLIWYIPDKYRGKRVTISWDIHKTGTVFETSKTIDINSTDIDIPAAPEAVEPTLQDPMLGFDAAHAGNMMVAYTMATDKVKQLTAHYKDVQGNVTTLRSEDLGKEISGFLYLAADRCYKDFYVEARYTDSENKERITQSKPVDLAMLHQPSNLTATLQTNGQVKLTWIIGNVKWADLMSDDMWEVQRCTSGTPDVEDKWNSIGQVSYSVGTPEYTFTDETLPLFYEGKPVYYRVRRATTMLWNWAQGSYASTMLPGSLRLPAVTAASVKHTTWNDEHHNVGLDFTLGCITGKLQSDGLYRDDKGNVILRTVQDWEDLAKLQDNNSKEINVIMAADIDLTGTKTMLGSLWYPYRGTFDGNGHTLNVNYDNMNVDNAAPFHYVLSSTIKNLHVTGLVRSANKFAGGLIGYSDGSSSIVQNCHVSTAVASTIDGDASNGGIIGRAVETIELTNCLFDGKLLGDNSHSIGGFIGAVGNGTEKVTNCLFAPAELSTKTADCCTFVRDANENSTITNSYYTVPYFGRTTDRYNHTVIYTTDDWNALAEQVKSAGGNKEFNIILGSDIEVTKMIGTSTAPFKGTFNGNGFTLVVNIESNEAYAAPFQYTKAATIKKVNVRGKVKGGIHSAGLVGSAEETLEVSWCHITTHVTTTSSHAGGILGHGHRATKDLTYNLFDGSVTATTFTDDSYCGALVGWEEAGVTNQVMANLENGTYTSFNHVGLNYANKTAYGGNNNYHYKNWGEGNKATGLSAEELVAKLGILWEVKGSNAVPKQYIDNVGQGIARGTRTPQELTTALGKGWILRGNLPAPVMTTSSDSIYATAFWDEGAKLMLKIDKSVGGEVRYTERRELTANERKAGHVDVELTTSCVDYGFHLVVERGSSVLEPLEPLGIDAEKVKDDKDFRYYFDNNVQFTGLETDTLQTSVSLMWTTKGKGDFFRILRYDKMEDCTDTLEHSYGQMAYIDRTPRPQHTYIYTIEGVNQCEGVHISSISTPGCCKPTGMVRGYVRMADGTAMAGITVKATPKTGNFVGAGVRTKQTDETGFFEIDSLIYQGSATYEISVEMGGDTQGMDAKSATFNDYSNLVSNLNFVQRRYYLFSGQVLYEGTSVPVVGAKFERDGAVIKNGSGQDVVSDSQGNFTLSIPQGDHTVRVVKDGHEFADDGYFLDPDAVGGNPEKHNWQAEKAGYIFWDQTQVTLRGRVVGGDVEGRKPLGQSLSQNNLGDSLTIVMQLEGDNASYLVRDQLNGSITERHFRQPVGPVDTCEVNVYRHRIVIHPADATGEYLIKLPPVKYKITEVYAQGYPTLFQAGEVGQTIDMTRCVKGDTVTWNRIYHATPTLAVQQFNITDEKYFGIKSYTDNDNTGRQVNVELWNKDAGYSFGYPVYIAGNAVTLMLSAQEQYFWNNDSKKYASHVVHLRGGNVQVQNGLISTTETKTIKLDSIGEAVYTFTPQNLTFTEEGDMALKTLTMTLEYDSTFYDIKPFNGNALKGFVMDSKAKPLHSQGRRVVADGGTYLIDILRDPPGAGSSAYIESGTKLSYSFNENLKVQLGVKLNYTKGGGNQWFTGVYAGMGSGDFVGQLQNVESGMSFSIPMVATYYNAWQYTYNFETTERISTSSGNTNVGRDADVFIGMTRLAIFEDAIAVRAIDDTTYNRIIGHEGGTFNVEGVDFNVRQGTMKVLATGTDSKGKKVYLVRDEVLQYTSQLKGTFAHSQTYIEQELIPNLITTRNSLMLAPGTTDADAQAIANTKGHPVYISHVPDDSDYYAVAGYYTQVDPKGKEGSCNDSISVLNNTIYTWINFLAVNEREKLEVTDADLVKTYDVDGRAPITYSETFSLAENESRYLQLPVLQGTSGLSFGTFTPKSMEALKTTQSKDVGNGFFSKTFELKVWKQVFHMTVQPVVALDYNYNYGMAETSTKKVGFTLAPSNKSQLTVNVYRSKGNMDEVKRIREEMIGNAYDEDEVDQMLFKYSSEEFIKNVSVGGSKPWNGGGLFSYLWSTPVQYRSLVYRTVGGSTASPYEDERKTKYYNAGSLLDAKTREIDRLRIWADEQTVSNVPYNEPARFTIHMANESEVPSQGSPAFTFFLDDAANAKGAKILIDGAPLTGEGHSVLINPGSPVTKQVEVYPGADFDYENIGISLFDTNDKKRKQTVYLSAHFVPTAGKVNISLPGDKWVLNTESQYDTRLQQYYMPVRIDGFDVNYRGFDHIELQYKLSTQGDKEWVNVCSYYKDPALYAKASGVCQMIEDDGKIMAQFYGEVDPVEQYYDLRAVCYCRHGGGFLTNSSDIITGVKDTRRPQLFGTPKPEDGILDIGDDIMLRFSEPIAGNYLRPANNFQVIGQTNSNNITLSTSLRFNGDKGFANTNGERNLTGKAFTVDVMLSPDNNGQPMTFFCHGYGKHQLELGLTEDRRLSVQFIIKDASATGLLLGDDNTDDGTKRYSYTSNQTVPFNGLRSVRYVFIPDIDRHTTTVSFYDGTKEIGTFTHPLLYEGYGTYHLGFGTLDGKGFYQPYQGDMLEFRLWNRALSMDEMKDYSMKHLTGYELGLMDNYPLSEGKGNYSFNRVASGSDLFIFGPMWKVPDGIGMILDGQKGFRLKEDRFTRWSHEDYTLMFWFRTKDDSGTLLANGRSENEAEAKEHFRFYVKGGNLQLNLGGQQLSSSASVNDGAWHHAAMTVSRSRNVGCLYVDQQLCNTFTVDTIGGIQGGYLAAGATYTAPTTAVEPISGHIDEIALFEMAMPANCIKDFASMTPTGEEMGLLAYLNFSRNELQVTGGQRLMPTGISLKRYKDEATGELTAERDTIVAQEIINELADRSSYAPMQDTQQLENIRYSFVADGKDLLINLDVPNERIEKTNVYVLVKDVADLNGNIMASPAVMNLYVYRNPLRWDVKRLQLNTKYGEAYTFKATVKNLSGKSQRFTLDGLPIWMTASKSSGSIAALDEETITFTISPYINIGNMDETICLVGEDGLSEPLPIRITVRGESPDWTGVSDQLKQANITMNVVAQVSINGMIMNDPDDRLAVFGKNHQLMGVTNMDADESQISGSGLAYLTIYNNNREATPLSYEYYDASTGIIHKLVPSEDLQTFKPDVIIGTVENPVLLAANNGMVQTLHLKKGWNWISFYVRPDEVPVEELMNNATKWEVGDGLEIINPDGSYSQLFYKSIYNAKDPKNPTLIWDKNKDILELDPRLMYRFYSKSDKLAYFAGFQAFESMEVKHGWNRIGYLSTMNLPLGTALADYTDKGSPGDIIKSQSEFAMLTEDSQGNKAWKGTLKYMRCGEGYMLKHLGLQTVDFIYPTYFGESRYGKANVKRQVPGFENTSGTSMTVVASALGVDIATGDVLTAWRGAERCGVAEADEEHIFYLNVGDADAATEDLYFTLERDGEVIASAGGKQIRYVANAALGTPDSPTAIRFVNFNTLDADGWYSLDGIKLQDKPRKFGVYIHNNEKVIIK